jgi:hypothetical protein
MSKKNHVSKNNPAPNTGGKSDKQSDHPKPEIAHTLSPSELPPSHAYGHVACKQEKNWWDKAKPFVEIAGIALLALYTGYTIKLESVAQKTYDASERPYIGIKGIDGWFLGVGSDGKPERVEHFTQNSTAFTYRIGIQNFGPVPGTNYVNSERVFFGDREVPVTKAPDKPTTLFPSETIFLPGIVRDKDDLQGIESKQRPLTIELSIHYDGPSGKHYTYCEKEQYDPDIAGFNDLGPQDNCE